jgi:putative inorganic carbon (HCO3(-)) transporter
VSSHQDGDRSRWKQMIVSSQSSHLLMDIIVFAMIALGLVFSRSRMGIAAAIVGVLLVAGIAFLRTRRRSTLIIAFLVLAIPVGYSFWIGLNPVVERFEVLEKRGAFEEDRLPIWRDSIVLIRDYPLLGTGFGTYRWASAHYQTHMFWAIYEHAHNDYLEFAAEIGIPATVLLFGSFWVLAVKVARRAFLLERTKDRVLAAGCAGAMVALLIHEITDFNLQIPANAYIFAWIAGTAAALCRSPVQENY